MTRKPCLVFVVVLFLSLFLAEVPFVAATEIKRTFTSLNYDGCLSSFSADYATAQAATTATYCFTSDFAGFVGQIFIVQYEVMRAFLLFDTSAVPENANITSAIIGINIYGEPLVDFNVTILNGQPTYPHIPLTVNDYYKGFYSGNGGSRNTSTIVGEGVYWNITLSQAGISWINTQGTTKLALFSSKDLAATPPGGMPDEHEELDFYMYEQGEAYAPKLYVTYEVEGYTYNLHGAYNEQGTRDGAINCTLYRTTEAPYTFELDGDENVASEVIPTAFFFNIAGNYSRIYYIKDTFEEIYVFKPTNPYYTYYFTVYDFIGITNGYLESLINVNGTDRVVERWKLTFLQDIPFTLSWGKAYKIRLVCDQGTYSYGSIMAEADYTIELTVSSIQFPPDFTCFGQNISVSATRLNATYIQILYLDSTNNTLWVYFNIKLRYGASAHPVNNTGSTHTVNWYDALSTTNYIASMTICHATLGTFSYSKALPSPFSASSPFDISFLGNSPIPPTQIFGLFIVLMFGGLASTKNVGAGLFLTGLMAGFFTIVGILQIDSSFIVVVLFAAFLVAAELYKKRR